MKVLTVIGARPQFVKAAVVSKALREIPGIKEIIVHTGQHFDENMSDIFFTQMEIPKPDYNLDINSGSHGVMTGTMLAEIESVIQREKPDWVLVYGDTNSTLAGALAAVKLHVKVAHVEAGLRSFNKKMPEEVNRILTDNISDVLFCPTKTAMANLELEGYAQKPAQVVETGDVMYDAVLHFKDKPSDNEVLKDTLAKHSKFVLATIHRAENTDSEEKLRNIFSGLEEINQQIPIVMPIHPRTKQKLAEHNISTNIDLIAPVGYVEMLKLINASSFVVTDSGGLQKEAYFLGRECITAREETEWVELVEAGVNTLVGSDTQAMIKKASQIINSAGIDNQGQLYGNGSSAKEIAKFLAGNHE
ncbi:non-hydrolyzing UDP-N-acetylglucosamine 2-epimerase [Pseudoalteromonas ruthenica]|uniref:UDP-N-acetylglucosamine 2-epimerase n=1 Tax=Pseudoalteromonas ruthenica TaxID=151081 RepID=A0A0F4PHQ8_9GAMM|nr:UDP-N-acetylglucosamine 2-epimerase (non-hydrolyzing) [Pseudoalteromonas ruthenica]KJY95015.1 UDP-N-acetylglucosamine 2-epimerase [Pseudoalteromonas ruthenica]KJY98696.1 UDP-N-acetylglucosamine 2-epimerase [Pseudoalteromonas ruthenica]TLX51310.1 UDP-N-acetylglucosamine 2-epimerase (non-hydrolyzing) [Pseudoalteromonas ruthenica]TMO86988.1 UDP-N-acetylglucosamine 2-epimerase (non-hydrolyzing) [Pseudoalteromonas ruthenica]TMO93750.1 UDP-N-acetylglucosamine 2-epimerase (non-hydrolyzing) [Pseudo